MTDEAQTNKPQKKLACLKRLNKTPRILIAGVLLIIAVNYLLDRATFKAEPIDGWSEETILVIRMEKKAEFWQGVHNILELLDVNLNTSLSIIKLKTGVSPAELAKNLLPEPVEFIVLQNNDPENGNQIKYDFILVTKADGEGIENIPTADNAARDFFSWYLPTKKYDILDDGSKIKSQIADPLSIKIKSENFRGAEINFISEPGLPFEYARTHKEGWLFFSTSKKILEQVISRDNQTIPFKVFSKNCASLNGSVQAFFNPKWFKVTNKPNLFVLGSPIRLLLGLLSPNKAKISSNSVTAVWDSCYL